MSQTAKPKNLLKKKSKIAMFKRPVKMLVVSQPRKSTNPLNLAHISGSHPFLRIHNIETNSYSPASSTMHTRKIKTTTHSSPVNWWRRHRPDPGGGGGGR